MSAAATNKNPARRHRGILRIYIDNSNLWLQGQKTYAEKMRQHNSFDPTWRFDVGRLKTILMNEARLGDDDIDLEVKVELYGSTPPPVDTVWESIKAHGVTVRTFPRSAWSGREKQVDHRLGLNSALQATRDCYEGITSEFMIVSGDGDMLGAVEAIVENRFPVHIWSWKNCLASVYRQQKDKLIQVHLLDDYLEIIGFRETKFRIDRTAIDPNSIVVLDPLPKANEIENFMSNLSIPVYRYNYQKKRADASSQDLVIIPVFAKHMTHEELVKLFQTAKAKLERCGLVVLTYFEYCQRYSKNSSKDELAISNRFKELSHPSGESPEGKGDFENGNEEEHGKDVNHDNE